MRQAVARANPALACAQPSLTRIIPVDPIGVCMTRDTVYSLGAGVLHVFDYRCQQLAHALCRPFALSRRSGHTNSPVAIVVSRVFLIADDDCLPIAQRTIGPLGVRTISSGEFDDARALRYFLAVYAAEHDLGQPIRISGIQLLKRIAKIFSRIVRRRKSRSSTRRAAFC